MSLIAPFLVGITLVVTVGRGPDEIAPLIVQAVLWAAIVAAAVPWRRSTFRVISIAAILAQIAGFAIGIPGEYYSAAILVFSVGARQSIRLSARLAAAIMATIFVGLLATRVLLDPTAAGVLDAARDLPGWAVVLGGALLTGAIVRTRRRYIESLLERTRQLAEERDRSAQLARVAERARIAREMHDVLSHGLQVVVSASDSALIATEHDPELTKQLVQAASDSARRSMREARLVFSVLKGSGPGESRSVDTMNDLVERMRTAGLSIEFEEYGDVGDDAQRGLAVYRITQEALTNTLRHAGAGTRVIVTARHAPEGSRLSIVDHGTAIGVSTAGSGIGIESMRERAEVLGGSLSAERSADGEGWSVTVHLPGAGEPQ